MISRLFLQLAYFLFFLRFYRTFNIVTSILTLNNYMMRKRASMRTKRKPLFLQHFWEERQYERNGSKSFPVNSHKSFYNRRKDGSARYLKVQTRQITEKKSRVQTWGMLSTCSLNVFRILFQGNFSTLTSSLCPCKILAELCQ